jgi:preprotein translocase subunit SecB
MADSDNQQPVFNIEKIYVKDLSAEVPNAPQIFLEREAPEIEIQLQSTAGAIDEGMYETTLTVTVTAKRGETTFFLVEVAQAGIFQIRNVPEADLQPILGMACPNILFPYAREAVSSAITNAGFPPVLLTPVNFEALYQQRRVEEAQAASPIITPLQ